MVRSRAYLQLLKGTQAFKEMLEKLEKNRRFGHSAPDKIRQLS